VSERCGLLRQMTRIWIDTDIGTDVDDAFALAFALRHREIEVAGVSTVFGDVELRRRMVEELLALAGEPDCPVQMGLGKPLAEGRAGLMLGHEGRGLLADPAPRRRVESDPDAERRVAALAEALAAARPDALVAIGPLTNVGALLRAGARLPRLTIMGGKTTSDAIPDTLPGVEEWNWLCDPAAVRILLDGPPQAAGLPRIVPAEVTHRTQLPESERRRLGEGDALCRALLALSEIWLETQAELGFPRPSVKLHDPLTVATLLDAALCPMEPARLAISEAGETSRLPGEPNVEVARDVEPDGLIRLLMETLLGA
jgi:purine nucleosidase